ncbi:MAG: hypothetical protein K2K95_05800 [Muribaculaceae bacterium]|nr:hypothetical protein [Muribaculaceae bacterium]
MTQIDIPLMTELFDKESKEFAILSEALACRKAAGELLAEERYLDAMERTVSALLAMREFPAYDNTEYRALLVALLFDLSEIHFALKNYKQSEKELDVLFKVLDSLVKTDENRFGKFHILAMELSTRILRSRKKALDLLVKQQINAGALYEKVNAGVVAATDKLVDSLRNVGQLLASTGDLKASLKFYAEAIKYSKKRTGRVTRKEVKMTLEMAEIMMRLKAMRPRALRLLNAILPHAEALETIELERDILALIEVINNDQQNDSAWKTFLRNVSLAAKSKFSKKPAKEADTPEDSKEEEVAQPKEEATQPKEEVPASEDETDK